MKAIKNSLEYLATRQSPHLEIGTAYLKLQFSTMTGIYISDSFFPDCDVFFVEASSRENSQPRRTIPVIQNPTGVSGPIWIEISTIPSVSSQESQIVTIESKSKDATTPYTVRRSTIINPLSLTDL